MKNDTMQVQWEGNMAFSTTINGHRVTVDAREEFGGQNSAPNPKSLMIMALGGCTGIDVLTILKKMKIEIHDLRIDIESTMRDEHPKVYTSMHLCYTFTGRDLEPKKLQRAIDLSQDKYCGVSAMYKRAMDITYEMRIVEA